MLTNGNASLVFGLSVDSLLFCLVKCIALCVFSASDFPPRDAHVFWFAHVCDDAITRFTALVFVVGVHVVFIVVGTRKGVKESQGGVVYFADRSRVLGEIHYDFVEICRQKSPCTCLIKISDN